MNDLERLQLQVSELRAFKREAQEALAALEDRMDQLEAFLADLLNPECMGLAVSDEVRSRARALMGASA